jgi:hypothetical protein
MRFLSSVRIIDLKDVHARVDELREEVGAVRFGTDGRNDLGVSHCSLEYRWQVTGGRSQVAG